MHSEENYLDDLLNSVQSPETVEPMEEVHSDAGSMGESAMGGLGIDSLEIPEVPDLEIPDLELPDLDLSDLELPDVAIPEDGFELTDVGSVGEPLEGSFGEALAEGPLITEEMFGEQQAGEIGAEIPDTEDVGELGAEDIEMPGLSGTEDELSLEDMEMPGSEDEFKLEDIEMPDEELLRESELSIDGLDQAIQSETELQMAGELNIDELEFENISAEAQNLGMSDDSASEIDASITMDDNLEDVLTMLDDDAELAEINDMLKKSDNNEPIQDDMMDLLHQMADDEAASVNAGIKHVDDDDDGVPLPEIPRSVSETIEKENKKKEKKSSAKKKRKGDDADDGTDIESTKQPGKLGKFFNLLTEELVPEPTEEELEAEKEAKKQEKLTKKEEEKLAKEEAKKAKAEEKAAADKEKQEAAAQKKKEKQAKKAAKEEAKRARLAAEGPKKRIPPKKIAVAAAFGVSVGGAIILATNILSTQGFLQTARNAYYDGDYKAVYEATYGMELDDSENDGLIRARSEVIFKVQRYYDSYQTNLKIGREVEALDALLRGITAYDNVNAEAERYEVMSEVDAVKAVILDTLESKYGLDETAARTLINNQDALSYTIALNDVIAGN